MKAILTITLFILCFAGSAQEKKADKSDSTVVIPIDAKDQADIAELLKQLEPLNKQLEPLQKQAEPIQRQIDAINVQMNTIIRMTLRHNPVESLELEQIKRLEYSLDKLIVIRKTETQNFASQKK